MQKNRSKSVVGLLRDLEVGDELTFPVERLRTIKVSCSQQGLIWDRVFTTSTNREDRTIKVSRTK
ncbi:MAG: hypothetical protein RRY07_07145 [Bacteroidaceae bacterium]